MTTLPPQITHKRNHSLLITVLIFTVLGLAWSIYWLTYSRFYEYTDDAYVDGNQVMITPRIPGTIISFSAIDGDFVEEGRTLVEFDREDATISLQRASAELADTVRAVARLFENAKRDAALVEVHKAEFIQAAQDYEHRKGLIEEGGVSLEDFEHAKAALSSHFFSLAAAEYQYSGSLAQIENTTLKTHPLIEKAKNSVKDAYLFYQRCSIKAPVSGIIAQRSAEVGKQVRAGQPLMAIIPLDQLWVTANFKENQLKRMRIGQSVSIRSDTYGSDAKFHGTISGIGGGTGSVFSLLPPQNATGNWIKIVQRVPVRITLDQALLKQFPLRLGLSLETTVDTHDLGLNFIPSPLPHQPLFETTLFQTQESGVEALIENILLENLHE